MQLFIKNKFISLRGSSKVLDAQDNPAYNVQGKFWTITRKKFVQDLNGNTLYVVRNKFWHIFLKSAFVYDANGEKVAQIKRKIALKSKFSVRGYKDELRIDGTFIGWTFQIYKNEKLLGTIKRLLDFRDSFVLDIEDGEDAAFFVALVIAMDNIIDAERADN